MKSATFSITNGIELKKVHIGYSWTTLFFGPFVPLFRQDWLWMVVSFILWILTSGLSNIVLSFMYNKIYLKSMFKNGYYVHTLPANVSELDLIDATGLLIIPKKPQ